MWNMVWQQECSLNTEDTTINRAVTYHLCNTGKASMYAFHISLKLFWYYVCFWKRSMCIRTISTDISYSYSSFCGKIGYMATQFWKSDLTWSALTSFPTHWTLTRLEKMIYVVSSPHFWHELKHKLAEAASCCYIILKLVTWFGCTIMSVDSRALCDIWTILEHSRA